MKILVPALAFILVSCTGNVRIQPLSDSERVGVAQFLDEVYKRKELPKSIFTEGFFADSARLHAYQNMDGYLRSDRVHATWAFFENGTCRYVGAGGNTLAEVETELRQSYIPNDSVNTPKNGIYQINGREIDAWIPMRFHWVRLYNFKVVTCHFHGTIIDSSRISNWHIVHPLEPPENLTGYEKWNYYRIPATLTFVRSEIVREMNDSTEWIEGLLIE